MRIACKPYSVFGNLNINNDIFDRLIFSCVSFVIRKIKVNIYYLYALIVFLTDLINHFYIIVFHYIIGKNYLLTLQAVIQLYKAVIQHFVHFSVLYYNKIC